METMTLITAGDSWTYGSEIRDPSLPSSIKDWDPENDSYRIPRIWSTKLAERLGIGTSINLSYPASSNDRIVRVTKNHLIENYISQGRDTSKLLLIVGWTSPERKDFYYKDSDTDAWITIWPMWNPDYRQRALCDFHSVYVRHMWNAEEYIHRYVHQLLDMQHFCSTYGIRYLFFQSFYQHMNRMISEWTDESYAQNSRHAADRMTWDLINPRRFLMKDEPLHSFHNYIMNMDRINGTTLALSGQHPSELAHTWWTDKLASYCKENSI